MDEKLFKSLLLKALEVSKRAYAPYSNFSVGCVVLLEDGRIIEGVNIENASYPVALCAERAAIATVVSEGLQHMIQAIAVVTKASPPGSPCGMCRQFLSEFIKPHTPIIFGNGVGEMVISNMAELLPRAFLKDSLI